MSPCEFRGCPNVATAMWPVGVSALLLCDEHGVLLVNEQKPVISPEERERRLAELRA